MAHIRVEHKDIDGRNYVRIAGYDLETDEEQGSSPWRFCTEDQPFKELNDKINMELNSWHKMGADPSMVKFNGFIIECKLEALVQLLVNTGLFTEEVAVIQLKEFMLSKLQHIRGQLTEQFIGGNKVILGPDGMPFQ